MSSLAKKWNVLGQAEIRANKKSTPSYTLRRFLLPSFFLQTKQRRRTNQNDVEQVTEEEKPESGELQDADGRVPEVEPGEEKPFITCVIMRLQEGNATYTNFRAYTRCYG